MILLLLNEYNFRILREQTLKWIQFQDFKGAKFEYMVTANYTYGEKSPVVMPVRSYYCEYLSTVSTLGLYCISE